MPELIGISGPQGSGKTTVMAFLKNTLYTNTLIDDFKVSRHVQQQFNYLSLSDAYKFVDSMINFQEEILKQKYEREKATREITFMKFNFTERTFLDIASYAYVWINKLASKYPNDIITMYNWFYTSYLPRCEKYQKLFDRVVYINPNKEIIFEHDDRRANQEDIDIFHYQMMNLIFHWNIKDKVLFINVKDLNSRIDIIVSNILQGEKNV